MEITLTQDTSDRLLFWLPDNMSRSMAKPIKWHVRPVKTQISLSIRPVWIYLGSLAIHSAHSEDPDQTGHWADPPSLIWVFAGCLEHFLCFVMLRHMYIEIPITWSNSWFGAVGADGDAKSLSIPGCVLIIEEHSLFFVRQMILTL